MNNYQQNEAKRIGLQAEIDRQDMDAVTRALCDAFHREMRRENMRRMAAAS